MEEDERRPKPSTGLGRDLRALSIADLEAYVAAMADETARVRAEIARRKDVRGAAEALFKKPAAAASGESA